MTYRRSVRPPRALQLLAPIVAVLLAWPGAPQRASAQTAGDAATDREVRYDDSSLPAQEWRLADSPHVLIGSTDGPPHTRFWNIAAVRRLPDGSWAVADWGSKEIRVFGADGEHLRTFGGEGEGPGELPSLWELWVVDGMIVARDGSRETHWFTLDGDFVRREAPPLSPVGGRMRQHGYLEDGGLIASYPEVSDPPMGRSTAWLRLVRVEGDRTVELGRFRFYEVVRNAGSRPTHLVFGPEAVIATTPRGPCVGYPDRYVFECLDPAGAVRYRVRRDDREPKPVGDAEREAYFRGIDEANPGARGAQYRASVRETTTFASEMPAYGRFVGAETGELWVGPANAPARTMGEVMYPPPRDATAWDVYSPDGEWLASVDLPGRFYLMSAGRDYVAGVLRDEFDIERVAVFRLIRDAR